MIISIYQRFSKIKAKPNEKENRRMELKFILESTPQLLFTVLLLSLRKQVTEIMFGNLNFAFHACLWYLLMI